VRLPMEEKNGEICKLLGLPWHEVKEVHDMGMFGYSICICGKKDCYEHNPDFSTDAGRVQLLREMMKRDDWEDFLESVGGVNRGFNFAEKTADQITILYITEPDLLIDTVLEFLRAKG